MAGKSDTIPKTGPDLEHEARVRRIVKNAAKQQSAKFVEAARDLGCDESEDAFDHALKKVATAPPPKPANKKTKKPAK